MLNSEHAQNQIIMALRVFLHPNDIIGHLLLLLGQYLLPMVLCTISIVEKLYFIDF